MTHTNDFLVSPNPSDPRLTERVVGIAHDGSRIETSVTVERPLTLYLNGREIVTMMTIVTLKTLRTSGTGKAEGVIYICMS